MTYQTDPEFLGVKYQRSFRHLVVSSVRDSDLSRFSVKDSLARLLLEFRVKPNL